MDIETERVVKTTTGSPKHKILVELGDDEQNATLNNGKQTTDFSDKVTNNDGEKDTTPVDDVSEQHVKCAEPTECVSSEIHLLSSKDYEFSADVTQAHTTNAASSEPPTLPQTSNRDDELSTDNVRVHDDRVATSERHETSKPLTEEQVTSGPTRDASSVNPEVSTARETLNNVDKKSAEVLRVSEINGNDRLILTDGTSSESVKHENKHNVADLNSGDKHHECIDHKSVLNNQVLGGIVNGDHPSGMQENEMQESGTTGISVLEDTNACTEVHSNATGSLQPTLDNLDDIKEPEEPGHATECQLMHDNEEIAEASAVNEDGSTTVDKQEDDDGWIYVLGHDKLKKRVITKGVENSRPVRGQVVTIDCVGQLEDGTEVDKRDNWSITLGEDEFIHAFDLCVAIMDKGETCEVVTESRFAYGELGRDPDIPPNATISYIIELIDCQDQREYSSLTVAERIQLSNEKRERGNYLYARNEYSRSIDSYTRALKALDEDFESHGESPAELQALIDTRIKCHNNMAAAQMKVGAWDVATKSCEVVLKVQPDNVKALFRKGKCLANKGDVSLAIPLLKRALKLEPETKIIHQELSRLERKNKAQTESEKALYQKMLGTDKETPVKKKKESTSRWLWYVAGGAAAALVSLGLTAYRYIHV